jgi:hypothetical protein
MFPRGGADIGRVKVCGSVTVKRPRTTRIDKDRTDEAMEFNQKRLNSLDLGGFA